MKKMTHSLVPILLAFPLALTSIACSGDGVTAENITLEECEDLFADDDATPAEPADDSDEMLDGDYDADGDEDDDDDAIEERCEELMEEDDATP